jgi:hypothetical protein
VKDGETVVIGGLIDTSDTTTEIKVPLLGDIPWLGALFRATNVESKRTELLIVLTVSVVRSEEDAYAMSVKMRDQSGIIPERIKANPLMEGLRIVPEAEQGLHPVDETAAEPSPKPRKEPAPNRPLYGPNPEVYGPSVPQRVQISSGTKKEVYGPMLVSHESPPKPAE